MIGDFDLNVKEEQEAIIPFHTLSNADHFRYDLNL
jgi:hypothetical protein